MGKLRPWLIVTLTLMPLLLLAACDERRKSDAELGLTPEQSAGRRVYDDQCDRCHEPYSSKGKKGPSLKGVFKRQYLSLSGLPANDERVGEIIRSGRKDMPAFGPALTQQQIDSLLVYLHTL
jgi:mono/diheme cytochrome c family protein